MNTPFVSPRPITEGPEAPGAVTRGRGARSVLATSGPPHRTATVTSKRAAEAAGLENRNLTAPNTQARVTERTLDQDTPVIEQSLPPTLGNLAPLPSPPNTAVADLAGLIGAPVPPIGNPFVAGILQSPFNAAAGQDVGREIIEKIDTHQEKMIQLYDGIMSRLDGIVSRLDGHEVDMRTLSEKVDGVTELLTGVHRRLTEQAASADTAAPATEGVGQPPAAAVWPLIPPHAARFQTDGNVEALTITGDNAWTVKSSLQKVDGLIKGLIAENPVLRTHGSRGASFEFVFDTPSIFVGDIREKCPLLSLIVSERSCKVGSPPGIETVNIVSY